MVHLTVSKLLSKQKLAKCKNIEHQRIITLVLHDLSEALARHAGLEARKSEEKATLAVSGEAQIESEQTCLEKVWVWNQLCEKEWNKLDSDFHSKK